MAAWGVLSGQGVRKLYIGAALFLAVVCGGTAAYVHQGWTLSDAFYMVVITVAGVGYGEVHPINTGELRTTTILIIVAGFASAGYFVSALLRVITEGEIGKAMKEHRKSREIDTIDRHVVICGYGRIGQTLARELTGSKVPFVVVDKEQERVDLAQAHGWLALQGDAGDERVLSDAHIEKAVALAAVLPSDMVNVFITLTARNMRADMRIIARAEDPASEKKLRQAGANEVILPAFTGGIQIAHSITHPSLGSILSSGSAYLRRDLEELGVDIIEHPIAPHGADDRKTLQQLIRGVESECLVLAVKRADGTVVQHPVSSYRLEGGDTVFLLAQRAAFQRRL